MSEYIVLSGHVFRIAPTRPKRKTKGRRLGAPSRKTKRRLPQKVKMKRIKLGERQRSVVEIYVHDVAHDPERRPWWPKLRRGGYLEYDPAHKDQIADLFTDISNAEEDDPEVWKPAAALSMKVRKS